LRRSAPLRERAADDNDNQRMGRQAARISAAAALLPNTLRPSGVKYAE